MANMLRGPYLGRSSQHLKARELRQLGYSYHAIAKEISDVSWSTIAKWTSDIPRVSKLDIAPITNANTINDPTIFSTRGAVRRYLIRTRGYKCSICSLSVWQEKPIPIEIHHKNGNSYDHEEANIELLCLNCHGQTENYRNRKRASMSEQVDEEILIISAAKLAGSSPARGTKCQLTS